MRSAVYSLFTTLMLLVAVSAVPLMAIFGVPQFAPAITSSLEDDAGEDWDRPVRRRPKPLTRAQRIDEPEIELAPDESPDWERVPPTRKVRPRKRRDSAESETIDSFADQEPDVPFAETASEEPVAEFGEAAMNRQIKAVQEDRPNNMIRQVIHEVADDQPIFEDLDAVAELQDDLPDVAEVGVAPPAVIEGFRRRRRTAVENGDPGQTSSPKDRRKSPPAKPPTWTEAVQRLNGFGIRNFRLEPGLRPGEFAFTCSYTHSKSPHVTRKFEAEADEPLKAVGKVLAQVEEWTLQRDQTTPRQLLETGERRKRAE